MQEIFNYALYDAPDVVRDVIGFGGPMDTTPLMLLDVALEMVWAPMVRILAEVLERRARRASTTQVERRPLERTIEVPGMGTFEAGTQGAFRFEVQGIVDGRPLLVDGARHPHRRRLRARLAASTAPGGIHRVRITGHPNLDVTIHGTEPGEPGAAGGGNATAANRIVNAIPAVCEAPAGPVSPLDLPPITGARAATARLTAPGDASTSRRYPRGSPPSRRRRAREASIWGSRWLMRRPTGCE